MDHPDERRLLDSQPSVAGAYTAWTTAGVALGEAVGNRRGNQHVMWAVRCRTDRVQSCM
jgi:hypothetical protein